MKKYPLNLQRFTVLSLPILLALVLMTGPVLGQAYVQSRSINVKSESYDKGMTSLSWNPNGTRLAGAIDDGTLKVWNPIIGAELKSIPVGSSRFLTRWSHDGEMLVTMGSDDKVKTWDPVGGANLGSFDVQQSSLEFALNPTDNQIGIYYSYWGNPVISVWNYLTGTLLYNLTGIDQSVYSISWSPDGNKIAAGLSNGIIIIWDVASQQKEISMTSASSAVYALDWSPDSKSIIGGCYDSHIRIWDVRTGKITRTLVMHTGSINSVSWSGDGMLIASGSGDKTTRIWNASTGADICSLTKQTQSISCVAFCPNSTFLASGSDDGTIMIYEKEFISLKIVSFTMEKTSVSVNEKDEISVSVRNDGNAPAENQVVEFLDNNVLLGVAYINLTNGSSVDIKYNYTPDSTIPTGSHRISVKTGDVQENTTITITQQTVSQPILSNRIALVAIGSIMLIAFILGVIVAVRHKQKQKIKKSIANAPLIPDQRSMVQPVNPAIQANMVKPYAYPPPQVVPPSASHPLVQQTVPLPVSHQIPAPSAIPQIPTAAPVPESHNVELKAGLDFISGYLVIKVGIFNHSPYSLTRCGISLDYNRKVFNLERVQPPAYEKDRSGDKVSIGEILPGDRRTTVEFYLDPYICTGGEISAMFSYHDHFGQPHDMRLQSKKVDVVCPVLTADTIDPSMLNAPSMWAIYNRLAHKNTRAIMVSGMPIEMAFELACEIVERRNVKRVRKGSGPEGQVAWYYGKTAKLEGMTQEWDFLINVWRKPDCGSVEFMVAADSQGAITGLLSKLGEEFSEDVERRGYSRPVTKIININNSVVNRSSLECA